MKIEYAKTNVFMNFLFFNNKINRNNEEKKNQLSKISNTSL